MCEATSLQSSALSRRKHSFCRETPHGFKPPP
jgi:hypothetical protein